MFNSTDCSRYYDLLGHCKETEVRLIDPKKEKPPQSVFVHTREEFLSTCEKANGTTQVYAGVCERREGGTKAEDVLCLNKVWVDLDPVRPKDTGSTLEEKNQVKAVVDRINSEVFGSQAIVVDSGNGYQLYARIPEVTITDENRGHVNEAMKRWTQGLQGRYNSASVKIDSVYELARIMRVPGTMNIKGDNSLERPHRLAAFVTKEFPEHIPSLLEAVLSAGKTEEIKIVDLSDSFAILLEGDLKIKRLFNGDTNGYQSRSEAEFALAVKLICYGYDDTEIDKILRSSKLGKWAGESDNYRKRTLDGARQQAKIYQSAKISKNNHPAVLRSMTFEEIMALIDLKFPFLVENHVYNERIGAMVGVSQGGKTWLALDLAVAVASGQPFLDEKTIQGNIGYLDGENGARSIKKRLHKLCLGRNLVTLDGFYLFPEPTRIDKNPELLIDEVKAKKLSLLVIDGIQRWLNIDFDTDNRGMSDFFVDVLEKITALGCAVIIIHHIRKVGTAKFKPSDELDLIRGVSELRNIARFILWVEPVESNTKGVKELVLKTKKLSDHESPADKQVHIEFRDSSVRLRNVGEPVAYLNEGVGAGKSIRDWFVKKKLFTFSRKDVMSADLGYEKSAIDNGLRDLVQTDVLGKSRRGVYVVQGGSQSSLEVNESIEEGIPLKPPRGVV